MTEKSPAEQLTTNRLNWLNNTETAIYFTELRQQRITLLEQAERISMDNPPNYPLLQQLLIRAYSIKQQLDKIKT